MRKKSEPIRTCLGCGNRFSKQILVRICYRDGQIVPDEKKVMEGRGAYVCLSAECFKRLKKNKRIFRALRIKGEFGLEALDLFFEEKLNNRSL